MSVDPVEAWMVENKVPLTRENYLQVNYLGKPPQSIDPEVESGFPSWAQLPEWRAEEDESDDEESE